MKDVVEYVVGYIVYKTIKKDYKVVKKPLI